MKTEEFDLIGIDSEYWIKHSIGMGIPCGETTKVLTVLDTGHKTNVGTKAKLWDWSYSLADKGIIIAWKPSNNAEFLELLEANEKQHSLFYLNREELRKITITKSMKDGEPAMQLLRLRHAIQILKQTIL